MVYYPPLRAKSAADRRTEAYARLGVSPAQVFSGPKITPLIQRLPGGLPRALELLRGSDALDARLLLAHYDNLVLSATDKKLLPIEAFAYAAGLTTSRVMGLIVECAVMQGALHATFIRAISLPDVVQASVDAAMLPSGETDRTNLMKASGFLPTPKNTVVNMPINVSASAQAGVAGVGRTVEGTLAAPSPEELIRKLEGGGRTLPAATAEDFMPAPQEILGPEPVPISEKLYKKYVSAPSSLSDLDLDPGDEERA